MQIEPLLREFAILVGRGLAQRWLRQCDRDLKANHYPGRVECEVRERNEGITGPERRTDID